MVQHASGSSRVPDPRLVRALVRWQHAAGPYWQYVCAAPFLGDGTVPSHPSRTHRIAEAAPSDRAASLGTAVQADASLSELVRRLGPPSGQARPLAVIADLPIERSLALAPDLARNGWYVVPVVQRWVADPAVLPSGELVRLLLDGANRVSRPRSPRGVLLLADGERAGDPAHPPRPRDRAFDNRYAYQICRFPSAALLRSLDVRAVRWVCPSGVARDLAPYAADLTAAGLPIDVIASAGPATRPASR